MDQFQAFISLGGTGLLAFIMWGLAKQFIAALQMQVDARIKSLEEGVKQCEQDRRELHTTIEAILERNYKIDHKECKTPQAS